MVCECCGKKKKLFDMFYNVSESGEKVNVCSDCHDIVDRIWHDGIGGEKELYAIHREQLTRRAEASSDNFRLWQQNFLAATERKLR